jgi:hypothetical protein
MSFFHDSPYGHDDDAIEVAAATDAIADIVKN